MLGIMSNPVIKKMMSNNLTEVNIHARRSRYVDGFPVSLGEFKVSNRMYEILKKKLENMKKKKIHGLYAQLQ